METKKAAKRNAEQRGFEAGYWDWMDSDGNLEGNALLAAGWSERRLYDERRIESPYNTGYRNGWNTACRELIDCW